MTLEAFGVKNLRCLTDTGLVPIRPITVLVGRNSSGKSTFLRAFPLLRQSVETKRSSPILWYDESSLVDFGSFREAANNRLSDPTVTFAFRVKQSSSPPCEVAMTLAGDERAYVSQYEILAEHAEFRWKFDEHGRCVSRSVNGHEGPPEEPVRLTTYSNLLPNFERVTEAKNEPSGMVYLPFHVDDAGGHLVPSQDNGPNMVPWISSNCLEIANFVVARFMRRVAYLAPARAAARRSYRLQSLAVDEVDPDGRNLAMFLRSLSPEEQASFTTFTRNALDFETTVRDTGHHAEILIREGSATRFVNLIDVGFGYSEALPLAATLWTSGSGRMPPRDLPVPLVAIEQPELHLHPGHQAKLARMLVESTRQSPGTKLLVETHSESLINGLGKLVFDGAIPASDIQLVLFDKDDDTGETSVTLTGYDNDGALQESWPYGFLSPVAERRFRPAAE